MANRLYGLRHAVHSLLRDVSGHPCSGFVAVTGDRYVLNPCVAARALPMPGSG